MDFNVRVTLAFDPDALRSIATLGAVLAARASVGTVETVSAEAVGPGSPRAARARIAAAPGPVDTTGEAPVAAEPRKPGRPRKEAPPASGPSRMPPPPASARSLQEQADDDEDAYEAEVRAQQEAAAAGFDMGEDDDEPAQARAGGEHADDEDEAAPPSRMPPPSAQHEDDEDDAAPAPPPKKGRPLSQPTNTLAPSKGAKPGSAEAVQPDELKAIKAALRMHTQKFNVKSAVKILTQYAPTAAEVRREHVKAVLAALKV